VLGDLAEEGQRQVHVDGIDLLYRSIGPERLLDAALDCGDCPTRAPVQVDGDEQSHPSS